MIRHTVFRLLATSFLLAFAATVSGPLAAVFAADVHVAVSGNDAADGATATPVRSLRRALDRVREIRAAEPDRATPIVVEVADGRHELAEPLVVLPADSGTESSPTVIRAAAGARPVVSGGREIAGWQVTEVNGRPRWTADLPDVKAGGWNFAQLFVNDQRRFRPVLPTAGWQTIAGTLEPTPANAGKGHDRFAFAGDDLRPDWANLGDVEVVATHRWTMSRLPIASIAPNPADPATKIVTFAGRTRAPVEWCSFPKGNRFLVENVKEALGEPGSWYLDRPTGTLTYCPRDGESPTGVVVIAPRLDKLLELRGDFAAGSPVAHLRFEGLTFAHGNWTLPADGQSYPQAEVNVGAAITAMVARNVVFTDCAVRQVGRYAVEFGMGCQGCVVERCEFVDLGGGGVLVGNSWLSGDAKARVADIAIRDTTIAHGGRIHSAAIGVWIGHASGCTVEHCHIHDFTYSGLSIGWTWGYGDSGAHHNRIAHNHIHDIGHGVLSDMGAVYTLGVSPGTVVEGNVIHDITSHDYGGWGLYTDEGSTGIVMRKNFVYRTSSGGFHQHYGRDNVIENNIFAAARDWQLQRTRVEEHTSFRFERNIVWWNSDAPLVKGDWTKGLVTKGNCYWHGGQPVVFPGGQDLAARQAAGQDEGSIVADPKFKDPAAGDFTLAADSPALPLGFEPLDPAAAGRRSPDRLTADMPEVPSLWIRPQPSGGAAAAAEPAFVIAARGQPAAVTIVLPAAASPSQTYAAEELQKFTAEMTGVTLPIADDTGPLPEHAILLGDTRHTAAVLGMSPEAVAADREGLGDDGFRLRTAGGHLCVLAGPVRGTLYGVYELLERHAGCRWYASWHAVIPQLDRFAVPALDDRQTPAFVMREPYWMDMRQGDFAARSRANGWSMQLDPQHGGRISFSAGLFVHTFERLCPTAEFFRDHPEYFSEIDGVRREHPSQLCLTNPDVERIVTERLLAIIRKDPGGRIVSVSQNDWAFFCTCPACKAIDDREESHAGTMIDFVNRVAASVEKEFPDMLVETLAYQYTRKPPKTLRPRRNVVPRLCSIECDFSRPIPGNPHPENTGFRADMAGWAAISPQLFVWDYTTNFDHYLEPFPNVLSLQANVQFFRDNRVRGVFEQGAGDSRLADFGELKAWLLAKWLWNPDLPAETLLDDFFTGFYGAAAPIVRQYFNEVHAFHDDPVSKPLSCFDRNLDVIPAAFFVAADEQFAAAERAVADSPQHLHNVRRARVAVVHARLAREPVHMARSVWVTREPEKFVLPAARRDLIERLLAGIAAEPDILSTANLDLHRERMAGWKVELATQPGPAADRALVEEGNFNLHRPGEWGEIAADPAAGNGSALKLFGSHFQWAATLPLEKVAFDPGVRYRLRLRARVESEPGRAGEAFWAGIHDYAGAKSVISVSRSVAEATGSAATAGSGSAGEYVWHDLGSWAPADGQAIWIGPGRFQEPAGSAVKAVWIDCLEIERE